MAFYITLCVGAVASFIFCIVRSSGNSVKNLIFKSIASLLFILTAVFAVMSNSGVYVYGLLIIFGGVLGLCGDILLDLKGIYKQDADSYLQSGFIFFLIGHIVYNIALIYQNKISWVAVLICLLISIVVSLLNYASSKITKAEFGKFKLIVIVYVVFLTMTCCTTIYSAFTIKSLAMILAAVGAVLFLISDAILSMTYFAKGFDGKPWIFINHFCYYAAQYLIAASIFFIEA